MFRRFHNICVFFGILKSLCVVLKINLTLLSNLVTTSCNSKSENGFMNRLYLRKLNS